MEQAVGGGEPTSSEVLLRFVALIVLVRLAYEGHPYS
jgi:hypothetical protein